eukprot:3681178-Pyramimonas_sp.AAC.1
MAPVIPLVEIAKQRHGGGGRKPLAVDDAAVLALRNSELFITAKCGITSISQVVLLCLIGTTVGQLRGPVCI